MTEGEKGAIETQVDEGAQEASPLAVAEGAPLTLNSSSEEILGRLSKADSVDEMKDISRLFHLSLAKKEASRALTQSELLDLVLAQAGDRIRKRPDEMSNKDLLDYMNAFQTSLDKTSKALDDKIDNAPPIALTQNNQEINIHLGDGRTTSLSEESRQRILDVVNALTKGNRQGNQTLEGKESKNE